MANFPHSVEDAAVQAYHKWKIPASVTLAQWGLESNYGAKMPQGSNNPFGIKARPGDPFVICKTAEVVAGKSIVIDAKFRKYSSLSQAFDDHGRLLAQSPAYSRARAVETNADAFADALTGIYATDPHYGFKLKAIMKQYNLYKYDSK